jgi:MoaA/NifB/PqqE/SkfB family radical SAM enzyme
MTNNFIKNGNYYILLDYQDNKRVALRLSESPDVELNPEHPELVDIKLTDVCHIGCTWCYQDSRSDSVHGKLETIKTVIKSLNPEITEVAFGGGDVLQHPDIIGILKFSREQGLNSSNITMNWQSVIRYSDKVKEVMPHLDAIGISITGRGQIKKVVESLKEIECYIPSRICFHVIPDLYNKEMLLKILAEVGDKSSESDVLFLGYKTNGRGKNVTPVHVESMKEIFEYIIKNKVSLQCDTKFVKDYIDVVKEVSSKLTYDIKEGEYSMNIDCVEEFYSQSSYNLEFQGKITEDFDITEAFGEVRKYGNLKTFN